MPAVDGVVCVLVTILKAAADNSVESHNDGTGFIDCVFVVYG